MSYNIFPLSGDTITESDWTAILDRANARDYVERGLTVSLNGDGTIDIGAGLAFIRDSGNNQTYPVEDESGTTGVQLADTSTTNYVYLTFDPSASDVEGSVEYHVNTDQTPPAGQPSLLIAEANESTSTITPRNQEPSVSANSLGNDGSAVQVDDNLNLQGNQDVKNAKSISTDEASITDETLVIAYPSSDQTGLSSGTNHTVTLDATDADARNEFDTTDDHFMPDQSGKYIIAGQATLTGTSSGDQLIAKLRKAGTTNRVLQSVSTASGSDETLFYTKIADLTAGIDYEVTAFDNNSSFDITGGVDSTFLTIRRAFD